MKKLLPILIFLCSSFGMLSAQIGITGGWGLYDAPEWDARISQFTNLDETKTGSFNTSGIQLGLDYWFRLEKKRIEFLPEISFYQMSNVVESIIAPDFGYTADLTANIFQLHFNTHIYPLDFDGDCNCPTFSKDGDVIKKGFFIRLAPGMAYYNYKESVVQTTIGGLQPAEEVTETTFKPTFRAGVGLDIGVSDFFTITPLLQYTFALPNGGFQFLDLEDGSPSESEITQLFFGLRLGFRFDELNKYGYR